MGRLNMDSKIAYMCAVDYDFHVENAYFGARVYPDLKSLKDNRPCVKGCGYVKIEMKEVKRRNPHVSPR